MTNFHAHWADPEKVGEGAAISVTHPDFESPIFFAEVDAARGIIASRRNPSLVPFARAAVDFYDEWASQPVEAPAQPDAASHVAVVSTDGLWAEIDGDRYWRVAFTSNGAVLDGEFYIKASPLIDLLNASVQ